METNASKKNTKYGKLVSGNIDYAPAYLKDGNTLIQNPTAEQYLAQNWKRVITDQPEDPPEEGYYWKEDGWDETETYIQRMWKEEPIPVVPRRWSRMTVKSALAMAEQLPAAKTYLQSVTVAPGYTVWDALNDCSYIEEFWPNETTWNNILDGAAAALGKTRAEIDAFLDSLPTEQ